MTSGMAVGDGAWVVLPTYNEAENLRPIAAAILDALPGATLLVVDDSSPDGTGALADELAAADPRVRVRHRPAKQGLGRAYLDGFGVALGGRRPDRHPDGRRLVARSGGRCRRSSRRSSAARRTSSSARATRRAAASSTGGWRGASSRAAASLFARVVLGLGPHDLTGGFKAWRAATLGAVPFDGVHAGGYVFQIEMTYRASRVGARVREVPITFRDRRVGQSKMSRRIIVEALLVVLQLRWDELRGRPRGAVVTEPAPPAGRSGAIRVHPGVRVVLEPRPAPGPGAGAGDGGLSRGAARRPSTPTRSPASRSRSCSRRTWTTRRRGSRACEVDRPAAPAADPPAALRRPDRRPVPPARRVARRGLAGRARRRGRRRVPRGRRLGAARLGAARRRDAPGSRARGSCRAPTSAVRRRGSGSGCAPARARGGGGRSSAPRRRRGTAARLLRPRRERAPGRARSPPGPPSGPERPSRRRRRRRGARARLGPARAVLRLRRSLRRPPGPARRCCGRSRCWPRRAGRPACRSGVPWPPRVLLVGATPGRPRLAGAGGGARGRRRRSWPSPARSTPERLAALSPARGPRSCRRSPRRRASPRSRRSPSGTPVVASAVGALPEIVGAAGHPRRAAATGAARGGRCRRRGPI